MTTLKKFIYTLLTLVIILVVSSYGLQFWLKSKIPKLISEKTDYELSFQSIDVSVLKGSLRLEAIDFNPKETHQDTLKSNISGTIPNLEISGIKFLKFLFKDEISVSSVKISSPNIYYHKYAALDTVTKKAQKQLEVIIGKFQIEKAKITYTNHSKNTKIVTLDSLDFWLDNIRYNQKTSIHKIPITFENAAFTIGNLTYDLGEIYTIKSKKITYSDQQFSALDFEMTPKISRSTFVNQLPKEKDLFTLSSDSIFIKGIDWGFENDEFYFHSNQVVLDKVAANIFRSKVPADDPTKKILYGSLLRKIPFYLEVNKLLIRESLVEYEEEFERGKPGKLSFSNFNATVLNINSGYKKTNVADVDIAVDCTFMHASKFNVNWRFNPLDSSDAFTIKGNLYHYPMQKTNPFLKPRVNVSAEGIAKQIAFNFAGNDQRATGNFLIDYDDLKITLYKKNASEENKAVSLIANMFVRNSTKGTAKQVEINTVERKQDRSFFNFLWLSVQQGLKQTLL